MAHRYRDTDIWDKAWYRKLSPTMKCVWDFLCDKCDHAGFWDIDEENLRHFIGTKVTVGQILKDFGEKIVRVKDKLWVTGYIEYQYRTSIEDLNPANRVHLSVINILKKQGVYKTLPRSLQGSVEEDVVVEEVEDVVRGSAEGDFSLLGVEPNHEPTPIKPPNPVAVYCEAYKARYGHNPPIAKKQSGILTQFAKDYRDWERFIRGYLAMPDQWAVARSHPVELLSSKLNEIQRFLETGKVVTAKVLKHVEDAVDKAQGTNRRPRKSTEELARERDPNYVPVQEPKRLAGGEG